MAQETADEKDDSGKCCFVFCFTYRTMMQISVFFYLIVWVLCSILFCSALSYAGGIYISPGRHNRLIPLVHFLGATLSLFGGAMIIGTNYDRGFIKTYFFKMKFVSLAIIISGIVESMVITGNVAKLLAHELAVLIVCYVFWFAIELIILFNMWYYVKEREDGQLPDNRVSPASNPQSERSSEKGGKT